MLRKKNKLAETGNQIVDKKYVTDTLDKTSDNVDEADVDTLEAGIGSTFGQNYTVND